MTSTQLTPIHMNNLGDVGRAYPWSNIAFRRFWRVDLFPPGQYLRPMTLYENLTCDMLSSLLVFFIFAVWSVGVESAPQSRAVAPTVQLDSATFVGTTAGVVNKFLGIPFGQSTAGNNRFRLPQAVAPYTGTQTATAFGPSCPQQSIVNPSAFGVLTADEVDEILSTFLQVVEPTSEDCLTVNVIAPAGIAPGANLPVVAWIFGGGFEFGGTSTYDGSAVVARSIALGQPVVYVSMNYRVSAWGFLASQEVKAAGVGNLGLQDQRLALKWIQKYITNFGGDPTKVTIWGESAGAISVSLHMLTNGGDQQGLFRGAFMESGSPIPVGDISHGQADYNTIVAKVGCAGSSDTLQCLRGVPEATLQTAVDEIPSIFSSRALNLAFQPRVDGVFLTDVPQQLVLKGSVSNVPFVTGDCDDEGTLFSLPLLNITTDAQFRAYMKSNYLPSANQSTINAVAAAYPNDITQGSPFNTGILNAVTPQFKRLAAIQGDLAFQAPRRFFLGERAGVQKTWAFLNKRLKLTPILGTFHASDILQVYGTGELQDYLIHFVNGLDPNTGSKLLSWPQYTTSTKGLMTLLDGLVPLIVTTDTYRGDAMSLLTELSLESPL